MSIDREMYNTRLTQTDAELEWSLELNCRLK